jgi:hypothetical protein
VYALLEDGQLLIERRKVGGEEEVQEERKVGTEERGR